MNDMQKIKELRERTQARMSDCKSALGEADGNIEKAVEIILKKGMSNSIKRAGAIASEGVILADASFGVMVEVNIQTDFAARNEEFLKFANDILKIATQIDNSADLSAAVHPSGKSVDDVRKALIGKLGENINIRRWVRLFGGTIHSYIHMNNKIGVLLSAKGASTELLDNLAMQIAAMNPLYIGEDSIPAQDRQKQIEIYEAQLQDKPEKIRGNIVKGKMSKWIKEVCLLNQDSIFQEKKDIRGCLDGAEVLDFVRYEVGEGIEKKEEDFAAEVAKTISG